MANAEFRNSTNYLFDSEMGREALAIASQSLDEDPDMTPNHMILRIAYALGYDPDIDTYQERPGSFEAAELAAIYAITNQFEVEFLLTGSEG